MGLGVHEGDVPVSALSTPAALQRDCKQAQPQTLTVVGRVDSRFPDEGGAGSRRTVRPLHGYRGRFTRSSVRPGDAIGVPSDFVRVLAGDVTAIPATSTSATASAWVRMSVSRPNAYSTRVSVTSYRPTGSMTRRS